MTALPLSHEKKEVEWQTILTTGNNFPIPIIKKLKTKIHNKVPTKTTNTKNGPHSHTIAPKSGKVPIFSNIQTPK
jgi:hypothetical protein